ncbi:PAN domain protein [Cooperia oncophora]
MTKSVESIPLESPHSNAISMRFFIVIAIFYEKKNPLVNRGQYLLRDRLCSRTGGETRLSDRPKTENDEPAQPDLFADEAEDKVIYMDNNCAGSQCYAPYITQYIAVEGKQLENELDRIINVDVDSCQSLCTQRLSLTVSHFWLRSSLWRHHDPMDVNKIPSAPGSGGCAAHFMTRNVQ